MSRLLSLLITVIVPLFVVSQDLSEGLLVNDLELHPMIDIAKPAYLDTIVDPSFGTTIRRISDAGAGGVIVPMYSTVQAWNADESRMILYNQSIGTHQLLDGVSYEWLRNLDDVSPADLEQIFWHFDDANVFYYLESQSYDFIRYSIDDMEKVTVVNLINLTSCDGGVSMGNNIQMMSWDSDVFTFRCMNEAAYAYRISTGELISFEIDNLSYNAPATAPSGSRFYHKRSVYGQSGTEEFMLNQSSTEHACIGKLSNGADGFFAIAFAQGPDGGCIGDVIAHDLSTGNCYPIISQSQGYDYPQSGTHISALAHKNTEGGWIAASMMGYDKDGQSLLDQELVIAKAEEGKIKVCRIGHHRSDEDNFDYWGEPHAVISPRGTRVLFASDWSGTQDGESIDSYVVELPSYVEEITATKQTIQTSDLRVFPNPTDSYLRWTIDSSEVTYQWIEIIDSNGRLCFKQAIEQGTYQVSIESLPTGLYFYRLIDNVGHKMEGRVVKL